jgi:hypothetical protein
MHSMDMSQVHTTAGRCNNKFIPKSSLFSGRGGPQGLHLLQSGRCTAPTHPAMKPCVTGPYIQTQDGVKNAWANAVRALSAISWLSSTDLPR